MLNNKDFEGSCACSIDLISIDRSRLIMFDSNKAYSVN